MNDVRPLLLESSARLRTVLTAIRPEQLDLAGLGEWSLRDLVGHTLRALVTTRQYYGDGDTGAAASMVDPAEYFRTATLSDPAVRAVIAERGRAAGVDVGDDPVGAFDRAFAASLPVLEEGDLGAVVAVAGGTMVFAEYLRTRLFELVVHTDDLCRALGVANPLSHDALRAVVAVSVEVASTEQLVELLRATAGRESLPADFTVLG